MPGVEQNHGGNKAVTSVEPEYAAKAVNNLAGGRCRRETVLVMSDTNLKSSGSDRIRRVTDEDEEEDSAPIQSIADMSMEELRDAKIGTPVKSIKPMLPNDDERAAFSEEREIVKEEIEIRKENFNTKRKREDVVAEIASLAKIGVVETEAGVVKVCPEVEIDNLGPGITSFIERPIASGRASGKASGRSRGSVRTCTNCHKTGHDRRNCNKPRLDR